MNQISSTLRVGSRHFIPPLGRKAILNMLILKLKANLYSWLVNFSFGVIEYSVKTFFFGRNMVDNQSHRHYTQMFKNLHFPFFLPFGQSITLGSSLLGQLSIGQYVQGLGNPWMDQLKIDQLKIGQSIPNRIL